MTTLLDRTFLGIEFGDDSVVLSLLKNSVSGINLLSSETFSLKEGVDTVNEVSDFISRQGADISNVFVSIPDRWAVIKFTDIPSIKGRNKNVISNMMKFEIERHIPYPIDSVAYDFLILQRKASSFSVVFVAVQNEKVEIVKDFLEKLALNPHTITISSFAVLSAIELSGVPVGGLQELIGITRRSNIFGNKDEIGASLFINGMNATLSIIREGLCIYLRTFELSADRAAQMLSEAGKKLSIERFDKLLVEGDISSLKDIAVELKEKLAEEKVVVNEISEFRGDVQGKEMNGLVASVGACFSGLGLGTHRINILPHKREYEIKKVAPLATKVFLFLVVAMLIGIFAVGAVKQKNYLEGLESALKENEPAVKALQQITSGIDQLKKQSTVLYDVKRNEIVLEVLAELTAVLPSDSWVTNLHYKGFYIKGKKAGGELIISGFASSSSILIPLLEDSVYLEKVEFVGPIKKKGLKEQFKIKAVVIMPSYKESG
jgi:Tfp pilus assembly PilM family ATPase/Tfp pilus assembly protein PilN